MKNTINLSIAASLLIGLVSCGPSTKLSASWKNPEVKAPPMNKVLVLGLTENLNAKQSFETEFTGRFEKDSINAVPGLSEFGSQRLNATDEQKKEISEGLVEKGYDAILVLALIDAEKSQQYVSTGYSGGYYGGGYGYYNSFNSYYSHMSPMVYQTGYYEEIKTFLLEANLYNLKTKELIWTGQTRTSNPSSVERFAYDFGAIVYKKMKDDGAIVPATE